MFVFQMAGFEEHSLEVQYGGYISGLNNTETQYATLSFGHIVSSMIKEHMVREGLGMHESFKDRYKLWKCPG